MQEIYTEFSENLIEIDCQLIALYTKLDKLNKKQLKLQSSINDLQETREHTNDIRIRIGMNEQYPMLKGNSLILFKECDSTNIFYRFYGWSKQAKMIEYPFSVFSTSKEFYSGENIVTFENVEYYHVTDMDKLSTWKDILKMEVCWVS